MSIHMIASALAPHSSISVLAVDTNDLQPVGQLDIATPLIVAAALAAVLAIALVAGAVLLSRPRRNRDKPQPRGAHLDDTVKTSWHRRIDDVVRRYHAEQIDRETAFIELAAICRGPRNPSTRTGLDTLRMTIAALYPPEYADSAVDTHAREVSVDDAAGWASTLVERWGR